MRPNYGNKRVYLEGEEKYHFPGGENGEESWGGRGQQKGRREREGARRSEAGSRWLVMVGLVLLIKKFEPRVEKSIGNSKRTEFRMEELSPFPISSVKKWTRLG